MANIIVVKDMSKALEEHDPFICRCDSCGKERKYTQKTIDKKKNLGLIRRIMSGITMFPVRFAVSERWSRPHLSPLVDF